MSIGTSTKSCRGTAWAIKVIWSAPIAGLGVGGGEVSGGEGNAGEAGVGGGRPGVPGTSSGTTAALGRLVFARGVLFAVMVALCTPDVSLLFPTSSDKNRRRWQACDICNGHKS